MSNSHYRRKAKRAAASRPSMLSYLATVAAEEEAEKQRMAKEEARKRREHELELKNRRMVHMRALVKALGGDAEAVTYDAKTESAVYKEGDITLRLENFFYLVRVGDVLSKCYAYPESARFCVEVGACYDKLLRLPNIQMVGEEVWVESAQARAFALDVAQRINLLLTESKQEEPTA